MSIEQYNPLSLEPLLPICQYVYDHYLSKPYTDSEITWDWELITRRYGVIQRPNHGLAHSMRVANLVPIVASFLNRDINNGSFDLTTKQIQLLQICALYSVVGRENDAGFSDTPEKYKQFRLKSAFAFEQFARANLNLTENEIRHYTHIVHKMGSPDEHSAEFKVLNFAHKLDLLRCYSSHQIQQSIVMPLNHYLSPANTQLLLEYAEALLHATGDRVMTGNKLTGYNESLFGAVSTHASRCIQAINSIEVPLPAARVKYSF